MERVLAIAGEIQAELDGLQTCPAICGDGMVQVTPQSGKPQRVRCPILSEFCPYGSALGERLEIFLRKLALDAGVPERHIGNFDDYIGTPALAWAGQWRFGGFLVLSGGSGVGKSFGAAWAFKEFLRSGIPDPLNTETWNRAAYAGERAMWGTANGIVRDKSKLDEARNKLFLVIDDLGREGSLSTRQADASDILSARYDEKLPTVVTTELSFNDILKAYGRNTAFKLVEDNGKDGGIFAVCGDFSLRHEIGDIWEPCDETDNDG
jgi:hypothetical protein